MRTIQARLFQNARTIAYAIAALSMLVVACSGDVAKSEHTFRQPAENVKTGSTDDPAITVVAKSIGANKLDVKPDQLRALANNKGEGTFVFVPKTRFSEVPRYVVWMVIDGQAYPLNAPTKLVTEGLPWPREAPEQVWKRTNLSPYSASAALEYVFGVTE